MSSRLFQEAWEKEGLLASAPYHSMFAETGEFAVYTGTTPSSAKEAKIIGFGELEEAAQKA